MNPYSQCLSPNLLWQAQPILLDVELKMTQAKYFLGREGEAYTNILKILVAQYKMVVEDEIINYDKLISHSQYQIPFEFSVFWYCDVFFHHSNVIMSEDFLWAENGRG